MGKSLVKDLLREIRKSFGRFAAIFAIVAIGVAFFAGVTASSGDMRNSADSYFDEYNLMDIRLLSSIGFEADEIGNIRSTEGVEGVFATHTMDVLVRLGTNAPAAKIMTLPLGEYDEQNSDYINRVRLKEGRLPEKSGECVVKYETVQGDRISLGDKIKLETGTDENIEDTLATSEYEVVGIVYTPYFISYEMGNTTIGNGKISHCVIIPESDFKSDIYSEVFVTVNGAKAVDTYSDKYFDITDKVTDRLKALGTENIKRRTDSIKEEIKKNVTAGIKEAYGTYATQDMIDQAVRKAEDEALKDSGDWQWYVLDRNSHYSYRDYGQCADRMDSIATVFPMFFIFVAALVCFTTMTRMVDEHRSMIGTFKALGYSKPAIAFKYICYALIASAAGGIIGCIIGLRLFPWVIYVSWNIMYELPPIRYANHTLLIILSIGAMAAITTISALMSCIKDLLEAPALLMRPKSPKKGKTILLERISFIWKRLKFSQKVTARNIFRYKKRFVMTIIGISGCTALLMAGFGVKDSIAGLIDNQFKQIFRYDTTFTLSDEITVQERESLLYDMSTDAAFTDLTSIYSENAKVCSVETPGEKDKEYTVSLIMTSMPDDFAKLINLRSRTKHEKYRLSDDGVILSEKLSHDLGVKAGEYIYAENGEGIKKQIRVSAVTEMYVGNYVFITDGYYEEIYGSIPEVNEIIASLAETGAKTEDEIGADYLGKPGVESISFFTASISKFDDTIKSLDLVTYVLIVSAAMLAFVVLYNLTNVNISERLREIATIKVLGFYDQEVASYVYKENMVMTILGALLGLGLGTVLHRFIMRTVEMEGVMYGYQIQPVSYALSFVLTFIFSLIVNLVMYRKLKNIQMVESLKSVE